MNYRPYIQFNMSSTKQRKPRKTKKDDLADVHDTEINTSTTEVQQDSPQKVEPFIEEARVTPTSSSVATGGPRKKNKGSSSDAVISSAIGVLDIVGEMLEDKKCTAETRMLAAKHIKDVRSRLAQLVQGSSRS
jgi:hypothetical protein